MKMPHAERAIVQREKIVDYLLDPAHPDNGGKAAFFLGLGYTADDWQSLAAAFCQMAVASEVVKTVETPHGAKYVMDGVLEAAGAATPAARVVRTIWIIDLGFDRPRLVTAYPCDE